MKLEKIWARQYANGVHFSTVKKDGFTAFVPESLALAMFLRAQLELLGVEKKIAEDAAQQVLQETERPRPRRTSKKQQRKKR